jgi:signal transduction histidine kinase
MELMNGQIEVASEVGKGSTFTLLIPVDASEHLRALTEL